MVVKSAYPAPPSGLQLRVDDPDVAIMYQRLQGYYAGREKLPGMAYFCLNMLEQHHGRRAAVATRYGISERVLDEIGRLSSTKGGTDARKAAGADAGLTSSESQFLEVGVKAMIRTAAEVAQRPDACLATFTVADLVQHPYARPLIRRD